MKKFILLVSALCMAGWAYAQMPGINPQVAKQLEKSFGDQVKAKAVMQVNTPKQWDTNGPRYPERKGYASEPYYNWDHMFGFNWIGNLPEDYDYEALGFCNAEEFDWVYGTGGFPTYFGSGEIGYCFTAGPGSFYDIQNLYPHVEYPYAAHVTVVRAPSTATCMKKYDEDGNFEYIKMPFYFKLYNSTKMAEQMVPGNISGYSHPEIDKVDVVYPTDPENYSAVSQMGYIPVWEDDDHGYDGHYPGQDYETYLEFDPDLGACGQPLGRHFALSMVFPVEYLGEDGCEDNPDCDDDTYFENEGGSSGPYYRSSHYTKQTWRWNAFPMCYSSGISTEPHSVFTVIDWDQQYMFGDDEDVTREKPEGYMNAQQTNPRYSIVPMDSWYWSNGDHTDAEPYVIIFTTEEAALQSANHADRYVKVSPNPATDYVNFKSFGKMQKIEIYSMNGKLVKSVNSLNADEYNFNISGLSSGMYVARITGEKGVSSKKIVVK